MNAGLCLNLYNDNINMKFPAAGANRGTVPWDSATKNFCETRSSPGTETRAKLQRYLRAQTVVDDNTVDVNSDINCNMQRAFLQALDLVSEPESPVTKSPTTELENVNNSMGGNSTLSKSSGLHLDGEKFDKDQNIYDLRVTFYWRGQPLLLTQL